MKIIKIIESATIIFLALCFGCSPISHTPLEELQRIGIELKSINHVEYSYQIKTYRSYSGDTTFNEGVIYFETNLNDTVLGRNYYTTSGKYESFYNGEYLITLLKSDSAAIKKPLCDYNKGHMTVFPYLELSFGAIQKFLTDSMFQFQIDSLIRMDTIFGNEKCVFYSFWADNILIDTHKKRKKGQKKVELIVGKQDMIPLKYSYYQPIRRKTKLDYHYKEAVFSKYSFENKYDENRFSLESVPDFYKWDKYKSIKSILATNVKAPDWILPLVNGDSISLSSLKSKFVLLDFWFIGCGSCIESVPILNELQERFETKLDIIGINCFSKDVKKIREYCSSQNMKYKNVWFGDIICDDYKVSAAPIFYLIDKSGKIVYSQIGHNEEKLRLNIEKILIDEI